MEREEFGSTTRARILDTAEELFSRNGIAATSLRALTRAAEVNLAAVHYHFGGKEALLDAVVARRAESVNRERLQELDRRSRQAAGTPSVEDILAVGRAAIGEHDQRPCRAIELTDTIRDSRGATGQLLDSMVGPALLVVDSVFPLGLWPGPDVPG